MDEVIDREGSVWKSERTNKITSSCLVFMDSLDLTVSIPSLQISFGIFKKLFDILERDVHDIDCQIFYLQQRTLGPTSDHELTDFETAISEAATIRNNSITEIKSLRRY
ncbi:uncharacterized protein LOC117119923 [Anneissia japonica]|uniref:uncharacterized protein LOC117119923 n=1 Tax=Anneissia japonica TaxID=1529436 RepID=UPI0014259F35|nr:uncharacterized protein LOC117119923 [Anneissia japonica]